MSTAKNDKSSDGGVVSNTFPYGLRVIVIDDDSTCLLVLAKMLQTCHYQVTKCKRAVDALSILRETRGKFDIVISDVHMPEMDGFRLLEIIGLEMDLPVVMTSADDKKDVVMKVIIQGACDYLIKPVRMEAIQFLWQHVVRKRTIGLKSLEQSKNVEHGELHQSQSNDEDRLSLGDKENCGSSNGGKDHEEEEGKDRDDMVSLKKPRMVWTAELHEQFVAVVNQFGLKNAVPKKILELMNVSGLTRENVASHLQKYRLYLRRQNESSRHQSKFSSPALHSQEFASSQLPQQSLTILQADVERSNAVFGSGMPLAHQMNLYNYGMVESTMPNQSVRDFGNMNEQIGDVQALQTSLRINPFANANNSIYGNQNSSVLMEKMQNTLHMGRLNEMARDGAFNGGETYHNPLSLPPTIIDFSRAHVTKLSEHDFSLESTPNASFLDNRNQEYTSDSSHEPVLFAQRFDQDDLIY